MYQDIPQYDGDDFPLDSQSDKCKRNVETQNQIAIGNRLITVNVCFN